MASMNMSDIQRLFDSGVLNILNDQKDNLKLKRGTIQSMSFNSAKCRVKIDGDEEEIPTDIPVVNGFNLKAGTRVALLYAGKSYVVIGTITGDPLMLLSAESPQVVYDMSFGTLRALPPGTYLVSSDATNSPQAGRSGNMIVAASEPNGWSKRLFVIVEYDNGVICCGYGGEWGFNWTYNMRMIPEGTYWGMHEPNGGEGWIRTTASGIIPHQEGGGNSALGTSSWPFAAIWGNQLYKSGRPVFGYAELYNNDSGTAGTASLNQTVNNFTLIKIIFKTNDGSYGSTTLRYPYGKSVDLLGCSTKSGNYQYVKNRKVTVSDMTISNTSGYIVGESSITSANSCNVSVNNNVIYITQVIGYY